eukprot:jgi/Psemu1/303896/fgenesh1_kg.127_\
MARMTIGLVLMVVSNLASWHAVVATIAKHNSSSRALRSVVWKVAFFYTLWALYNRYLGGRDGERGHISMGLLTLSCLATSRFQWATKIPVVASSGLVVLNFAVVIPMIYRAGGPGGFAEAVWGGDTTEDTTATATTSVREMIVWGYTFAAYVLSNIGLWSWVLYQFVVLPLHAAGGDGDDTTTTTTSSQSYEALATSDV